MRAGVLPDSSSGFRFCHLPLSLSSSASLQFSAHPYFDRHKTNRPRILCKLQDEVGRLPIRASGPRR